MKVIPARNVNDALAMGCSQLFLMGCREESRQGPVLRSTVPVTTVYARPRERVLFAPWRDANPFFHLVESLWMLAGRDDLASLTPYVKRMAEFSDDGVTQPGAYGRRWRSHFFWSHTGSTTRDQLTWAIDRLRINPSDRRVVIQMWDPEMDIPAANLGGKDVPCNLTMLPWVMHGELHLTVFCRSNDIIWGAYGANAVHFSVLLEYMAARLGLEVGTYTQISNNFHGYLDTLPRKEDNYPLIWDLYTAKTLSETPLKPYPMFTNFEGRSWTESAKAGAYLERTLQEDLLILFEHGWREAATKARWPVIRQVAVPLMAAHQHWKKNKGEGRYLEAMDIVRQCQAEDWRVAASDWLARRWHKAAKAGEKANAGTT